MNIDHPPQFPQQNNASYQRHLEIIERSKERNEGQYIHILNAHPFFDVRRIQRPVSLGIFSWSCTPLKIKWLSQSHVINYGGGFVTPGDLARDYLAIKYGNRRIRCTTDQWKKCVQRRAQPPIFVLPSRMKSAVYMDLTGAFWQIVRAVGWDVEYNPGKFLYSRSRMIDFPYPAHKLARNCLVSVGCPAPLRLWTGTEIKWVKKPSRFTNLILWQLVQDVLNGVARDMIDLGSAYIYTDGYILNSNLTDAGLDVLNDWGLEGRIKAYGECDIVATNCYAFHNEQEGFSCTKNYKINRFRMKKSVDKTEAVDREWLRPRFKKFAEFAQAEWEWTKQ